MSDASRPPHREHRRVSGPRRRWGAGLTAATWAVLLATGQPAAAGPDATPAYRYRVMAVFVYEFTNYLQWPGGEADGPFEIQVLGDSPIIDPLLEIAARRSVGGRAIRVRPVASLDHVDDCQVLFISSTADLDPEALGQVLGRRPILTVGEKEGLGERGVAVNFILCDGRVCFEINRASLERAGITASSRLLGLARLVGETGAGS